MTRTSLVAGAGGLLAGVLLRSVSRGGEAATTLIVGALLLCVVAPFLAAEFDEADVAVPRPLLALVACAALLIGLGLAGPAAFGPGLVAGLGYLLLWALTLIGVTCSCGRAGQPVATALGVVVLAFPYYAELVRGLLGVGDLTAMALVLHAPLPVLSGSFGDVDLLRQGALYQRFPLGQAYPYSYPAPAAAFFVLVQLTAVAWARPVLPRLWERLRRPSAEEGRGSAAPLAIAVAALVLVGAPDTAQAQLFPQPSREGKSDGDLVTRVRLGYWVAVLDGDVQIKGNQVPALGSRFSFNRHLDLDPEFLLPTFEVELSWENTGRIYVQYIENRWKGERQTKRNFVFEEQTLFGGNLQETKYTYRTIAIAGAVDLPISDWLNGYIITTQRYVKHEITIRGLPQGFYARNSLETYFPTIGIGAQVLIWNVISAYGDVQWLDFRTSAFGGEEGRFDFKYREFRFGARLSLVEHAHVMVEYYHLETQIKDGKNEKYKNKLLGVRVQVSILF